MSRRIPALVIYGALGFYVALLAGLAFADHALWPIVNDKQLVEGSHRADIFREVECCTGLRAPLPRLAKTAGEPCPTNPAKACLGLGSPLSGWYDVAHATVIVPIGNDEALRHEFIHHLKQIAQSDGDFDHDGPKWECE